MRLDNEHTLSQIDDYNGNESPEKRKLVRNIIIGLLVFGVIYAMIRYSFDMPSDYIGTTTPSELMTKVYGKYDSKAKCWHNGEYCMEIYSSKVIDCDNGKRLYLIAIGDVDNGCHACSGAVGAFIVKEQYGADVIIAQNKMIEIGSWGRAPKRWKLVKLGSNDYWGWINKDEYGNQGYDDSWYSILAPYGETIKSLGTIMSNQNNSGAAVTHIINLHSKLKIDDSNKNLKIYPLLITVIGINNGKKIKPIQYKINFDLKKWEYTVPSNYIIK